MDDDTYRMRRRRSQMPALLGGRPQRSKPAEANDEPSAGVALLQGITVDAAIARALGWQATALAAELIELHAPGRGLICVPAHGAAGAYDAVAAAIAQLAPDESPQRDGRRVVLGPVTLGLEAVGAFAVHGLTLVPVDLDPHTLTMSVERTRAALDADVVAIMPAHENGRLADMPAFAQLVEGTCVWLVENCLRSHGARLRGDRPVGTYGHVALFADHDMARARDAVITFAATRLPWLVGHLTKAAAARRPLGVGSWWPAYAASARELLRTFDEDYAARAQAIDGLERAAGQGLLGIMPLEPLRNAERRPVDTWAFRTVPGDLPLLSPKRIAAALGADLGCEFGAVQTPLAPPDEDWPGARSARDEVLCIGPEALWERRIAGMFTAAATQLAEWAEDIRVLP